MKSIIECIGRQEQIDKNGKAYVRLFFRNWKFMEFTHPMTGEVVFIQEHSAVGHINQYPESYTSSKRPDAHFMCKVGDYITGEVVQRTVQPYTTEKGFTINYYNAVVFGDSSLSSWEDKIRKAFSQNGMVLLPNTEHKSFEVVREELPEEPEPETVGVVRTNLTPEQRRQAVAMAASMQNNVSDISKEDINF